MKLTAKIGDGTINEHQSSDNTLEQKLNVFRDLGEFSDGPRTWNPLLA